MKPRIESPVMVPGVLAALQQLSTASSRAGIPAATGLLVILRASQINGCSVCVDMHSQELRALGESDARILTVSAWRDTPYFTDAERAALALSAVCTRLADRRDPVPDAIWDDAARFYDDKQLGALVLSIAQINAWNRINVATRQITGEWVKQWLDEPDSAK